MQQYQFFASCPVYLEELLKTELESFGATDISISHGGVSFFGTKRTAYTTCLWSRIANRLLLPLNRFTVLKTDDIKIETENFEWEKHFDILSSLSIDSTISKSKLCTTDYAALCVKDGIVDRARKLSEHRPAIDNKNPDVRLHIHININNAEISLDLSGEGLHKRGYRLSTVRAGIRENTAAAMLYRAGWNKAIDENGFAGMFFDPMCGSGTLVTEAAMISADIAPALNRKSFGFEKWKEHDSVQWNKIKAEAKKRATNGIEKLKQLSKESGVDIMFEGRDIDPKAVIAARTNINSSPLAQLYKIGIVKFSSGDFFSTEPPKLDDALKFDKLLAVNPPYGERLNRDDNMI